MANDIIKALAFASFERGALDDERARTIVEI